MVLILVIQSIWHHLWNDIHQLKVTPVIFTSKGEDSLTSFLVNLSCVTNWTRPFLPIKTSKRPTWSPVYKGNCKMLMRKVDTLVNIYWLHSWRTSCETSKTKQIFSCIFTVDGLQISPLGGGSRPSGTPKYTEACLVFVWTKPPFFLCRSQIYQNASSPVCFYQNFYKIEHRLQVPGFTSKQYVHLSTELPNHVSIEVVRPWFVSYAINNNKQKERIWRGRRAGGRS